MSAGSCKNITPLFVPLRKHGTVLVREVSRADKRHFEQGITQLSAQSLYYRFHSPCFKMRASHLAYFTEVDQVDHVAIAVGGGIDPDGGPSMGVGRYTRLLECPDHAEIALTVLDAYQKRGIGTLLLAALSYCARLHGVRVFSMHVHAERRGLIRVLQQLDAVPLACRQGIMELEWTIPDHFDVNEGASPTARWYQEIGQYIQSHMVGQA